MMRESETKRIQALAQKGSADYLVVKFVGANPGVRSQDLSKKFGGHILKIAHQSSQIRYEPDGQDKRWYLKKN